MPLPSCTPIFNTYLDTKTSSVVGSQDELLVILSMNSSARSCNHLCGAYGVLIMYDIMNVEIVYYL